MLRIIGHIFSIAVLSLTVLALPAQVMAGPEDSVHNYEMDR